MIGAVIALDSEASALLDQMDMENLRLMRWSYLLFFALFIHMVL